MVLGEWIYLPFMFTLPSTHTFRHDHCNHSDVNSQVAFAANLSMITYSCNEGRHTPKSKQTPMSTSEVKRKPPWERPVKMGGVRFHASLRVISCGVQTHTWMQKSAMKWASTPTMHHGVSSLQIKPHFQKRWIWNTTVQNTAQIYRQQSSVWTFISLEEVDKKLGSFEEDCFNWLPRVISFSCDNTTGSSP